jgi:DNA repair protein RecN (Recombination protein N)
VLVELTIRDFAIIDHLHIEFGPAFNVLTGETGAGKSIIVDAVASLLGGKLEREQIRAGAEQTLIEAVFTAREPAVSRLRPLLLEHGLLDGDDAQTGAELTLILSRDLRATGRSVCRINGRAVPLKVLSEVGQYLIDIHGQGDHILLLRPREQVGFLDRYAGLTEQQAEVAAGVRQLRAVRQELEFLRRDERELARRVDLLQYEVNEIQAARLTPGEEEELTQERDRLANAEKLAELAGAACALLFESEAEGAPPAVDLISQAAQLLADIERVDPSIAPQRQALQEALYQLEDVNQALRSYRDGIEFNPRRLQQVESRLGLIYNLRRKYGDSIADILAYAAKASAELSQIEHAGERIAELERQEDALLHELGRRCAALSQARFAAGQRLAQAVEQELAELHMERARFAVQIEHQEASDGVYVGEKRYHFTSAGIDQVEFVMTANVGEPLRPLAAVASGGETSRLMLALKNVLAAADEVPILIFDEIEDGIGGVVGGLVGQKLRRLASNHQVLCVTHLPQLAAAAQLQFKVEKVVRQGRTITTARPLAGDERVREIALMLGSVSPAALQSAREMLEAVSG